MARVVVFGPSITGDAALDNSRWVAAKNAERLGDMAAVCFDTFAIRSELEGMLDDGVKGLVLCGHGDGGKECFLLRHQHHARTEDLKRRLNETSELGAVYGSDEGPALDADNIAVTAGRWVHVIACEVGFSKLPDLAMKYGAAAFAAYEQSLVPEVTIATLPAAATAILTGIATMTTASLAGGNFDQLSLESEARRASEVLDAWFDSDEGMAWLEDIGWPERAGLTKFAKQLSSALRVVTPAVELRQMTFPS